MSKAKGNFLKYLRGWQVLLTLIVGFALCEWWSIRGAIPPSSVIDFGSFVAWESSPGHMFITSMAGKEYLVAEGPKAGLVPSGPSCYVFDRQGLMIDKSLDIGDQPSFQKKWYSSRPADRRSVDIPSAMKWLAESQEIVE